MKYVIPGTHSVIDGTPFEGIEAEITPGMAKVLLKHANPDNRKLNAKVVEKYTRDMNEGNWQPETNIVVFWDNGIIADGHHRLTAISRCSRNISVRFVVIPAGVQNVFDIGRKRSEALISGLDSHMISGIRVFIAMTSPRSFFTEYNLVTIQTVRDFYDENEYLLEESYRIAGKQAGWLICAIYAAKSCGVDSETLEKFVTIFKTGISTSPEETSAVYAAKCVATMRGRNNPEITNNCCAVVQTAIRDFVAMKPRAKTYSLTHSEPCYTDALRLKYANGPTLKGANNEP